GRPCLGYLEHAEAGRPGRALDGQALSGSILLASVGNCNTVAAPSCGASADAITPALAPAGRTPTVLVDSGRRLVGARYAVVAARHPAHRAPLAGLSRLR